MSHLIANGIRPTIVAGKQDAASIYALSERIKRRMIEWIDEIGIIELVKVSRYRKPRNLSKAREMVINHIDNTNSLSKLNDIMEMIEEKKHDQAWNKILS